MQLGEIANAKVSDALPDMTAIARTAATRCCVNIFIRIAQTIRAVDTVVKNIAPQVIVFMRYFFKVDRSSYLRGSADEGECKSTRQLHSRWP